MELIHTSDEVIKKIHKDGTFDTFLFFSASKYLAGSVASRKHYTYKIEIEEEEILEASRMFYLHEPKEISDIISTVMSRYGVDEDTACNLLDESESIYDVESEAEDLAEAAWEMQTYTAKAARSLGYRGVQVTDEQGAAWMIDMFGREADLVRVPNSYRAYQEITAEEIAAALAIEDASA
ncbi:AcrIF11 family anti-CRISPR ADP-ribosyltransferase [Acetobacter cibinongensis]|uniref:Uncharacterized protein n=1 Tax=Acetobacter cibinongensis TaxID=146475 RepID=A0A1Z5YRM5_9PROT|nr:hypothetical protein [Acetobacter cibinongensis]OUI99542.1 hypothetical protein HK14_14195 [Acetobacter cibinongensis]